MTSREIFAFFYNDQLIVDGFRYRVKDDRALRCQEFPRNSCPAYVWFGSDCDARLNNQHLAGCSARVDDWDSFCLHSILNRKGTIPRKLQNALIKELAPSNDEYKLIKNVFDFGFCRSDYVMEAQVVKVYKVNRNGGRDFTGQERLISWHSSSLENVVSILENGLTTNPPKDVKLTGRGHGVGIYSSRISGHALEYCHLQPGDKYAAVFAVEVLTKDMHIVTTEQEALKSRELHQSKSLFVKGRLRFRRSYIKDDGTNLYIPHTHATLKRYSFDQLTQEEIIVFDENVFKIRNLVIVKIKTQPKSELSLVPLKIKIKSN